MSMYYGDSSGKAKKVVLAGIPGPQGPQGPQGEVGPQGPLPSDSEILGAVKRVGGAGSGIDADLLDGKHAKDFADATHTHRTATASNNGFLSSLDKQKLNKLSIKRFESTVRTLETIKIPGLMTDDSVFVDDYSFICGYTNVTTSDRYGLRIVNKQDVSGNTVFTIPDEVNLASYDWQDLQEAIESPKSWHAAFVLYYTQTGGLIVNQVTLIACDSSQKTITIEGSLENFGTRHNAADFDCTKNYEDTNFSVFPNYLIFNYKTITGSPRGEINAGTRNLVANRSYAFGEGNFSSVGSFAFGYDNYADGSAVALGSDNYTPNGSFLIGRGLKSKNYSEVVVGRNNNDNVSGIFVVGNSFSASARSNGFRVDSSGKGYFQNGSETSGADFAEYLEWFDANPSNEDRRGRFVTLDGSKIRLASSEDDFILGIISGRPAIVGNSFEEEWSGRFLTDVYGTPVMSKQIAPAIYSEEGVLLQEEREYNWYTLNPEYRQNEEYVPRSKRPEWGLVGLQGQVVVTDDGTCQVNGYCLPGSDGIATATEDKRGYRVMERKDANHVLVYVHGRIVL